MWHASCELLRECRSHLLLHLPWIWHSWVLSLVLSSHTTHWLHTTTSWHSTSTSSLRSFSSHVSTTSLSWELLLVLPILSWNSSSSLWEWLSSLEWLTWLCLGTDSHVSNTLNDLVKDLMNFSVFLSFLLLFDFLFGEP